MTGLKIEWEFSKTGEIIGLFIKKESNGYFFNKYQIVKFLKFINKKGDVKNAYIEKNENSWT